MKKYLILLLAITLVLTMLVGCSGDTGTSGDKSDVLNLSFPTATTSGSIYPIGAAIANLWNEKIDGIDVSAEASNGGVQNLSLMSTGDAQLGVAVTSIITDQKNGVGAFEGNQYDGVRILTALYSNYNQLVTVEGTEIESLRDLKGRNFAPGAPGSTPEVETRIHLEAAGMKYPDDINPQFVGFTEAVDLIRNQQLDGAWIQAGLPTSAVTEICATANGKLVPIDEDVIDKLVEEYPWYNKDYIPAGTYDGQDEDIMTTSIVITIVVDESVPEDAVYEMTKVLWENIDSLKSTHNALKDLTIENAVKNLAGLPIHDGAARYYKEQGVLE